MIAGWGWGDMLRLHRIKKSFTDKSEETIIEYANNNEILLTINILNPSHNIKFFCRMLYIELLKFESEIYNNSNDK